MDDRRPSPPRSEGAGEEPRGQAGREDLRLPDSPRDGARGGSGRGDSRGGSGHGWLRQSVARTFAASILRDAFGGRGAAFSGPYRDPHTRTFAARLAAAFRGTVQDASERSRNVADSHGGTHSHPASDVYASPIPHAFLDAFPVTFTDADGRTYPVAFTVPEPNAFPNDHSFAEALTDAAARDASARLSSHAEVPPEAEGK